MTAPCPAVEPVGRLDLQIGLRAGRSVAVGQYHQGALRVIRPHYLDDSGQVYYTIVNPGGGYLGGDRYQIDVEVKDGSSLLLTSQSATKVYRTPGDQARQDTTIRLGCGAVLEYVPDQLIAYREASYRQETHVDMHPEATYVSAEVVTPGWAPDGSLFRYDEVRLRSEVRVGGELAVVDNLVVRPGKGPTDVESLLFLEGRTHLGTLLAVDRRVDAALVDEVRGFLDGMKTTAAGTGTAAGAGVTRAPGVLRHDAPSVLAGVTLVGGPGLAVRVLGSSTEEVTLMLHGVVNLLRARWTGQGALGLRKY